MIEKLHNLADTILGINNLKQFDNEYHLIIVNPNAGKGKVQKKIHKIANKGSQQADGLLKLKATYKIGATGTLIVNSPISSYTALK